VAMGNGTGPRAWYLEGANISPVKNEHFVGKVSLGGAVNFNNISFNPHGHITHTECVGHISKEFQSVNQLVRQFFYLSKVLTVTPEIMDDSHGRNEAGDRVITRACIEKVLASQTSPEALVIRTHPNDPWKLVREYSNTNPIYVSCDAIEWLVSMGVNHLLLDVPSVDRESDGGKLLGHHAFWEYPLNTAYHRSITELIFVPEEIEDGEYLLDLQFAPIENDASPSRPVLYKIHEF